MEPILIDLCDSDEETGETNSSDNSILLNGSNSALPASNIDGNKSFLARCHQCHRSFPNIGLFLNHMKSYHGYKDLKKCDFCDLVFSHEGGLQLHIQTDHPLHYKPPTFTPRHSYEESIKCPQCNFTFSSDTDLEVHIKSNHSTASEPSVSTQSSAHIDLDLVKCPSCDLAFSNAEDLETHTRLQHLVNQEPSVLAQGYSCDLCGEKFNFLESLKAHEFVHTIEKKYCIAEENPSTLSEMQKFSCTVCLKAFLSERALLWHEKRKHFSLRKEKRKRGHPRKIQNHQLSTVLLACNKNFSAPKTSSAPRKGNDVSITSSEKEGKRHKKKKSHSSNESNEWKGEIRIKCVLCGETFQWFYQYVKHKEVHSELKTYACTLCPEKFCLLSNLKLHQFEHLTNCLKCRICDKPQKSATALKQHELTHTSSSPSHSYRKASFHHGAPRYHQKWTTAFIAKKKNLSVENSVRLGTDKPVDKNNENLPGNVINDHVSNKRNTNRCKVCHVNFIYHFHYLNHLETHDIHKPFGCKECHETFALRSSLKIHELVSHFAGRLYFCKVCKRPYDKKANLNKHLEVCFPVPSAQPLEESFKSSTERDMPKLKIRCDFDPVKSKITAQIIKNNDSETSSKDVEMDEEMSDEKIQSNAKSQVKKKNYEFRTKKTALPAPELKRYDCKKCDACFFFHFPYVQHMERHNRKKRFSCHVCDKSFAFNGNKKAHILRTHFTREVYYCEFCTQPFHLKGPLTIHLKSCYLISLLEKKHFEPFASENIDKEQIV